MNGSGVFAADGTNFPQLLVWKRMELSEVGRELGKAVIIMVVQSARIAGCRGNSTSLHSSGALKNINIAQPTGKPESRRAAAYVCVDLACTSSIILETRAKNGENAFLLRVASVAKCKCDL